MSHLVVSGYGILFSRLLYFLSFKLSFLFQFIKELLLKEKIDEKQMEPSKNSWEELMRKSRLHFEFDAETSEFRVMATFLSYIVVDHELVMVFDQLKKDQNYPYVVLLENPKGVEKASLIIEQSEVFKWSQPTTYDCILSVLASYYVFSLQFPNGCKAGLNAVANMIVFGKTCKNKKIMTVLE